MPHCADSRGGGMTDTPTGLSRHPDTGHGARTQHHPPRHSEPPPFLLPLPACAGRRRRPGPAAAARSALRADPGHRRLSRRAHRHAEEDQKHQRTRLTDPAPFRDDQRFKLLPRTRSGARPRSVDCGSGHELAWEPAMSGAVAATAAPDVAAARCNGSRTRQAPCASAALRRSASGR